MKAKLRAMRRAISMLLGNAVGFPELFYRRIMFFVVNANTENIGWVSTISLTIATASSGDFSRLTKD